jgi:hypothetical protein
VTLSPDPAPRLTWRFTSAHKGGPVQEVSECKATVPPRGARRSAALQFRELTDPGLCALHPPCLRHRQHYHRETGSEHLSKKKVPTTVKTHDLPTRELDFPPLRYDAAAAHVLCNPFRSLSAAASGGDDEDSKMCVTTLGTDGNRDVRLNLYRSSIRHRPRPVTHHRNLHHQPPSAFSVPRAHKPPLLSPAAGGQMGVYFYKTKSARLSLNRS